MSLTHYLINNDVRENGTSRDGTTMANTIAAFVLQGHQNLCAHSVPILFMTFPPETLTDQHIHC